MNCSNQISCSFVAIIIFVFCFFPSFAQQPKNIAVPYEKGDSVTVSVLALKGYPGLTTAFGHSQFRVVNHTQNRDDVVDFAGRANWEPLSYMYEFFFGDLYYDIFTYNSAKVINKDIRTIEELTLKLTKEQKEKLMDILSGGYFLMDNAQYKYDYLHKNCTILMRDVLEDVYPNLTFPKEIGERKTLRQLYAEGLVYNPWIKFFSDVVLGTYNDQIATREVQMFNPIIFYEYLRRAKSNGELIGQKHRVLVKGPTPEPLKFYQQPGLYVWLIFVLEIVLTLLWYRNQIKPVVVEIYDRFWFFISAFFSLLIIALWTNSNYEYAARNNWNLLWLNPLFAILLFLPLRKNWKITRIVAGIVAVGILVALVGWNFIPQTYNIYFLPLMLTLLIKVGKYVLPFRSSNV